MDENLVAKLKAMRQSLPEAEKAVADFILRETDAVPGLTIYELTRRAGVSTATAGRLARRLGCASFRELKVAVARESGSPISALWEGVAADDTDEDLVRKVFGGNIRSLEETLQLQDTARLRTVARAFAQASCIVFVGAGSSGHVAEDAALRFCHLGLRADACTEPLRSVARVSTLRRGDVAVAVSHSGRTATTVECMRIARERGAQTVGITNYGAGPLAEA